MSSIFGGKRILVVEDEAIVAMMLTDNLEELGFEPIEVVGSCRAALASATERSPDVALLDLRVLDGDTVSVAEFLRDKNIPFVFMSGDPHAASRLGFVGVAVLGKPFSPASSPTGQSSSTPPAASRPEVS